jgi:hypothetical protein
MPPLSTKPSCNDRRATIILTSASAMRCEGRASRRRGDMQVCKAVGNQET